MSTIAGRLETKSALELAALVRRREISSEELVRFFLARIERLDPRLTSFVQVTAPSALGAAKRKDRELVERDRRELPPFHGVPLGIKDLNFVRGTYARMGSRAFRWLWSPVDDRTSARLRRGGFVFLGKLSTSEFAAMPVTEPDIHAPTRNPWDLTRTPGGSSGGSAAAVAAGLIPIAHGSDGAGSIRIPSSLCNLFGFKPARGRVRDPYGLPDRHTLASCGPIASCVEDAAAMLDVLAGISEGAPHWAPPPGRPFLELARVEPPSLLIRFTTESPLCATHPEVAQATVRVARLLEQLGHRVEEGPPLAGSLDEFLPIWQRAIAIVPIYRRALLQPVTRWLTDAGKRLDRRVVLERQRALAERVVDWFGAADIWLTPTVAVEAPTIGAWRHLEPLAAFSRAAELGAFTAIYNISGQPAATVPAGISSAGLPIGVQLAGRPLADGQVLSLARQLERAMPWAHRRPPLEGA